MEEYDLAALKDSNTYQRIQIWNHSSGIVIF